MEDNAIPKIIHYCWFGGKKSKKVIKTINEWKKICPDYKIIEWNENNFKIDESCQYVKDAFMNKKWAFVTDYVRLYALFNYGGIYLDTDVQLLKSFDSFLNENMFISQESANSFCTAVIGSKKNNTFIGSFIKTYETKQFYISGYMNLTPNSKLIKIYADSIYNDTSFDNEFVYKDIHIYPQTYFCGKNIFNYKLLVTDNTISIHHLDASWYSAGHKLLKVCKRVVMTFVNLFRKK